MENMSYNLKFATLCAKYNLGLLMNEPEPITGGLLHRMYRLQTDKAQYAVKAFKSSNYATRYSYVQLYFF